MIRLVVRSVVVASIAAVAIIQLGRTQQTLVWEILLIGVVIWQLRELPRAPAEDPSLFELSAAEPPRLPRSVASAELSVIDVLSGHLAPDRRLQPTLKRIAEHRLGRRGMSFDSPSAVAALGPGRWKWLAAPGEDPPSGEELAALVGRLEDL